MDGLRHAFKASEVNTVKQLTVALYQLSSNGLMPTSVNDADLRVYEKSMIEYISAVEECLKVLMNKCINVKTIRYVSFGNFGFAI